MPGTFVYTPAAGTVLNAGAAQTLSVTFTPTDAANFTTATKTVSINVLKATPVITWSTPADITYGTALSATQLNATASTPGTFAYTPIAGTVLNAGSGQTLSVTFTPTDAANFTTATKTVSINVLKATPVDHVGEPGGHHLRHRAECDAAERDRQHARHVRLHAGRRDRAERRVGPDAVRDLHADRRGQLHDRDEDRLDQRAEGDADDHVVEPGGHHLRHGAERARS